MNQGQNENKNAFKNKLNSVTIINKNKKKLI